MVPPNSPIDAQMVSSTGRISPQDFARLRTATAPLRRYVGVELPCPGMMYDAPSVGLHWRHADGADTQVGYYTGCSDTPERLQIATALEDADRIFHEATGLH